MGMALARMPWNNKAQMILACLIGAIIGLVLGLTGAGGSVFAVPMLDLLLGLPVRSGCRRCPWRGISQRAVWHHQQLAGKYILWIPALLLGLCGALLAPWVDSWEQQLSANIVLLGFRCWQSSIAVLMWRQATRSPAQSSCCSRQCRLRAIKTI